MHKHLLNPRRALALLALAITPSATGAQAVQEAPTDDPFAPAGVGTGAYQEMTALLEVTVFHIDVLTLTVRVTPISARRLQALALEGGYRESLADSVAAVVLESEDLWARQVLERDVGLGRLLDGMRESSEGAADAGFISREYQQAFSDSLPHWFAFLEEDGAKEGDEIVFWVRGDTVRTLYRTADGRVLMDQSGTSADGRKGSVPSFFAPGSRFRRPLVESLLQVPRPSE